MRDGFFYVSLQSMKLLRNMLVAFSALWVLVSCGADKGERLQQLEMLERMNRADSVMTNDSLAEDLVSFFDKHGTPNERMRAYYILGRTYFDMGDAPKAIETYNIAQDCADLLSNECDYKTLSRIHGQKAGIFRQLYLPHEACREYEEANKCAMRAHDTLSALNYQSNNLVTYYQRDLFDSLLILTDTVFDRYISIGNYEGAASCIGAAIRILWQRQDISKVKYYTDFFISHRDTLTDKKNRDRLLNYYLGSYYLILGKGDSAVFHFKNQLKYSHSISNCVQAYHGLFGAYKLINQKDSAAKYAELYSIANDSSNVFESADRIQKMQASFKYEHIQKKAMLSKKENEYNKKLLWLTLFVALAILYIVIIHFRNLRIHEMNHMRMLNQEYNNVLESYERAKQEVMVLEKENSSLIELKEHEIDVYKTRLKKFEILTQLEDNKEDFINDAPLLKMLHKRASSGKRINDEELEALLLLIEQYYPNYFKTIEKLANKLTYKQKSLCALTKLFFIPSEIGSLLDMRYQAVTNMRARRSKVLFGELSDIRDFDKYIHQIC